MGDRCWMQIRVRADQIELFCKASGLCEPDFFTLDGNGGADAEFEEVNYGGDDALDGAARAGVVFVGRHDAGLEYGPMRFASVGGGVYDAHDASVAGDLMAYADDDGKISASARKCLKDFAAFYKKAEAALAAKNPPKPKRKQAKS